MSKNILKVFHLQDLGFFLITWEVREEEIHLRLKAENQASCPACGHISCSRYERGKWRKVYHGYGFGRKVYLLLRKDRHFCLFCKKAFTEKVPLVSPWQRRTEKAEG